MSALKWSGGQESNLQVVASWSRDTHGVHDSKCISDTDAECMHSLLCFPVSPPPDCLVKALGLAPRITILLGDKPIGSDLHDWCPNTESNCDLSQTKTVS